MPFSKLSRGQTMHDTFFAWEVSDDQRAKGGVFFEVAHNSNPSGDLTEFESAVLDLALDDAEAIGYSLLYAVKLQRDAAKETEERE